MSNSQEQYISYLKQIKEAEEKVYHELETRRNQVEQEIENLQEELKNTILAAEMDGKKLVETNIEQARVNATKEAEQIIAEAEKKSKNISIKLDKETINKIIDILFSEI